MKRHAHALNLNDEGQYLILGFLFLVFFFGFCVFAHSAETVPTQSKEKPDASSFIVIKNKTPEQMFADANYLYQLGEYESALILFNKVASQTTDKELKRKANMAREVIDILTKAERLGGSKGEKEAKRAGKIKERQKKDQIAYLYTEAYNRFYSANYEQSSEIFKAILAIDPLQKEAKYYFQDRIPQLVKEQKVKSLYKEALQYFGIQDYAAALKLFNEISALAPEQKSIKDDIDAKVAYIVKIEKIKGLYEQVLSAFNGSNYEAASKSYREILSLDPAQDKAKEYLEVNIPQKLKEQRIAVLYKEALAAFNNKEYDKSKQIFYDILSLDLNQAEAKDYVEAKIPGLIREQKINTMLEEGVSAFNNQEYAMAKDIFNKVLNMDAAQAKALEYAEVRIPEALRQEKIKGIYREAVESFSIGDYKKADILFKDILALDSTQAQAKEYVQVTIPGKLKEIKVSQLYSEALGAFNNRDYTASLASFKEILELSPEEKEAKEFVQDKIPQMLAKQQVKDFYQEAVAAFNAQDYETSIKYCEQVLALDPGHQQARQYLEEEIPNKLKLAKEERQMQHQAQLEKARQQLEKEQLEQERLVTKKKAERQKVAQKQKQKKSTLAAQRKKTAEPAYERKQPALTTKEQASVKSDRPEKKKAPSKRTPDYTEDGVIGYLYSLAFDSYEQGDYASAQGYFTKILLLEPREKVANDYLTKIVNRNG